MKSKSKNPAKLELSDVIRKIKEIGGDRVKFIILYGSAVKGELTHRSTLTFRYTFMKTKFEDFKPRLNLYYASMGV